MKENNDLDFDEEGININEIDNMSKLLNDSL